MNRDSSAASSSSATSVKQEMAARPSASKSAKASSKTAARSSRARRTTSSDGEDVRRRISLACNRCRTRKIKCSGDLPSCKNCEADGALPCTYTRVTAEENEIAKAKKKAAALNRAAMLGYASPSRGGAKKAARGRKATKLRRDNSAEQSSTSSGMSSPYLEAYDGSTVQFVHHSTHPPASMRSALHRRGEREPYQPWNYPTTAESSAGEFEYEADGNWQQQQQQQHGGPFDRYATSSLGDPPSTASSMLSERRNSNLRIALPPPIPSMSYRLETFQLFTPPARLDQRPPMTDSAYFEAPKSAPLRPALHHHHSYHPASHSSYAPDVAQWTRQHAMPSSRAEPTRLEATYQQQYHHQQVYSMDGMHVSQSEPSGMVYAAEGEHHPSYGPAHLPSYDEFHLARQYLNENQPSLFEQVASGAEDADSEDFYADEERRNSSSKASSSNMEMQQQQPATFMSIDPTPAPQVRSPLGGQYPS